MKNTLLLLGLVTVCFTSACTPKDVLVTDPKTRADILDKKNGAVFGSFKLGGASGALFLLEKEVEAIELLKATQSPTFAAEHKIEITTTDAGTILSNAVKQSEWTSGLGKVQAKQLKTYAVLTEKDADQKVTKITLKGTGLRSSVDVDAAKKSYVNLNEDTIEIVATLENDQWAVTETSKGSASASASGVKTSENFELSLNFRIIQADLAEASLKISSVGGAWGFVKASGAPYMITLTGGEHTVTSNTFCQNVEGGFKGTFGAKGTATFSLTSDAWSISLYNKVKSAVLNECSVRPTVDLTRLLVSY